MRLIDFLGGMRRVYLFSKEMYRQNFRWSLFLKDKASYLNPQKTQGTLEVKQTTHS